MVKWDANEYDKNSSAQRQWARELIGKLNLNGSEQLLDIGCGDGFITSEIAKMLPDGSAVGIDSSPEMIGFALRRLVSDPLENLTFKLADARELDFENEFDVAFSNAALHWVRDNLPVLVGVGKALKSGGKILFQMGGHGNASGIFDVVVDVMVKRKWKDNFDGFSSPYRFYSPKEYEELLIKAGLKPVRVEMFPKDMTHDGPEGLAGWFRTTWLPFIERIPEESREDFVQECIGAYLDKKPLDADGKTHMQMSRLEVEAVKP